MLIAISLTLFGVWAKSIVSEHRRLANQQMRFQAVRLAEAGLLRGQALLAADAEYDGETWQIPAEALGGPHAAAVRISITRRASADGTQIQATAEYPLGSLHRAQVTKRINMPQPFSEDES